MKIKALLTDFDGTLVNKDILDVVCGIVGKEELSLQLNEEFVSGKREGLPTLITRINFLHNVSLLDIKERLAINNYLIPGAIELFNYLKAKDIVTILHSGNILPVLEYYKNLLKISYVVGTNPKMSGDIIDSISIEDFPGKDFKLVGCRNILSQLAISPEFVLAMGDSPADEQIFSFAAKSIAVNPK